MAFKLALKGATQLFIEPSRCTLKMWREGQQPTTISLEEFASTISRSSDRIEFTVNSGGQQGGQQLLIIATTEPSQKFFRELSKMVAQQREGLLLNTELLNATFESIEHPSDPITSEVTLISLPEGQYLDSYLLDATREDIESLYQATRLLEEELQRENIWFKRLHPDQIIVDQQGRLHPYNYGDLRFNVDYEGLNCGETPFTQLRAYIFEQSGVEEGSEPTTEGVKPDEILDTSSLEGYLLSGELSDDRIVVKGTEGFGYLDGSHREVIAPRYLVADDFREGRAAVQSSEGWGLIDLWGREIIPTQYDSIGYNCDSGISTVNRGSDWSYFDYRGEQLIPFSAERLDEDTTLDQLRELLAKGREL